MQTLARLLIVPAMLFGCSVSNADSSFWTPSQDLGGPALAGAGGAAGESQSGSGGEAGFAPGGFGGVAGSGGSVATGGGGGGTTSSGGGGSGGGTNSGVCALHFEFTTLTYHGQYSPKNIGAVWIENAQGQFVKSLNVWAAKRIANLVKWNAASKGNKVDAITAATASKHGPHSADWDCTDAAHQAVPDGPYRLRLELTEEDSSLIIWPPGPSASVDFTKGTPTQLTPTDLPNYVSMLLTLN